MAEGLTRARHGDRYDVASAGIQTHGLNPLAVKVMDELGIDISAHHSKTTADLGDRSFDVVITVCGHANETCPVFPAHTRIMHQGFDDPPRLAANAASEAEALAPYRRVRDEIDAFIEKLPALLDESCTMEPGRRARDGRPPRGQ